MTKIYGFDHHTWYNNRYVKSLYIGTYMIILFKNEMSTHLVL